MAFAALAAAGKPFPLSDTATKLDQQAIDAVVEEARENDVDVTTQSALLYKGLMLFQDEEYESCIPFLEEALRMDPSLTSGLEALGWAYVRTGRPERGYDLWEYFRTLMPDNWMPYNLLAQAAIMNQDWIKADEMFRVALEKKPDLFDQKYWYGQNMLRMGKIDEGEKIFRELIKREPERLDVQIDLANVITHKFEYEEATQIWRNVNKELPGNPKFMMNQADLELRIGELRIADRLCRDVLEMDDVMTLFPDEARRARNLRVDVADIEDQSTQSVKRLQEIIEDTEDPGLRSQLRLRLANRSRLLQKKDPMLITHDQILDIIREAIRDNPNSMEAMVLYAEQCVLAKNFKNAQSSAKYILENFNKYNIRAKDVLFECALVERRFDDAEQILLDRYATSDPTSPLRYLALARVQMARGDFQSALETLDLMESTAQRGTVLTLLYHGLTESDWIQMTSARRLREHVNALQDAGFVFIAPSDIPKYAGLREGESSIATVKKLPWLARTLDYLVYQVSGYRRFRPEDSRDFRDAKPMKFAAITFDDGLRSSFVLGTDIAEYVGAPFGMFVITKPAEDYQPAVGGWEEFRKYAETGVWQIGSHLYGAHELNPVDREGKDIRFSLPNRLWLPAKNRIESMNEWDERMRAEFRESRRILKEYMGPADCEVPLTAYPYGDIGQESTCNLSTLSNPMKSILAEASRTYQLGFVQSVSGYTTVGDNLLMCRRYEPRWNDEGSDVVRAVYESHPVFMARRTRIDLAIHMDRPHMAEEMIRLLRRDGYPEELLREIENEVRMHFRNMPSKPERPLMAVVKADTATEEDEGGEVESTPVFNPFEPELDSDLAVSAEKSKAVAKRINASDQGGEKTNKRESDEMRMGDEAPLVALSDPFAYGEVENSKAIDQFSINRYGLRAGLNMNPNTTLAVEGMMTELDQTVHPRWNAITNDTTKVLLRDFEASKTDYRLRLSHRIESGATIAGSIGQASLDLNYDDENTADLEDEVGSGVFVRDDDNTAIVGDLGVQWYPRNDMSIRLFYVRDLVQTAVKFLTYNSIGGVMEWRPVDILTFNTKAQYWSYYDDNALYNMVGSGLMEVLPDQGVYAGLEGYVISASHACDYYWTPYWDQRISGLLRYQRDHQGYNFFLDFLVGFQREDGRSLRRKQDNGLASATEWGYMWGFRGKYNQKLTDVFSLGIEANVAALKEYIDHQLVISLNLQF